LLLDFGLQGNEGETLTSTSRAGGRGVEQLAEALLALAADQGLEQGVKLNGLQLHASPA
jgi:hypothetical protein